MDKTLGYSKAVTVAQIAHQYLTEQGFDGVAWGDTYNLDTIAKLCTHTNLSNLHPLTRHKRLLDYLEKSPLFTKRYYRLEQLCRVFYVVKSA